jgi:NAD(P)-dependent dehydrogenase (short-subunit alcohol dehydrogenase family)
MAWGRRPGRRGKAYGDSKLANILFTRELHRRFHSGGPSSAAFHPGNVASNFASDTSSWVRLAYHTPSGSWPASSAWKEAGPPRQRGRGCPRPHLADRRHTGADWTSGAYYEKQQVAKTNKQASDDDLAVKLWDRSADMVGLSTAANPS